MYLQSREPRSFAVEEVGKWEKKKSPAHWQSYLRS